jgi:hypothetical protein
MEQFYLWFPSIERRHANHRTLRAYLQPPTLGFASAAGGVEMQRRCRYNSVSGLLRYARYE